MWVLPGTRLQIGLEAGGSCDGEVRPVRSGRRFASRRLFILFAGADGRDSALRYEWWDGDAYNVEIVDYD